MNVFMPVYKGDEEEHIMASHAERLKMSRCFIESNAAAGQQENETELYPYKEGLTCVTCHNPHVSVKETGKEVFSNACKKCHGRGTSVHAAAQSICKESEAVRAKVNDNCVQCHMKKNNTLDIPHVSVTDHFIRKPVDSTAVRKIKEFVRLACINNPNPPAKAVGNAYLSYFEKFSRDRSFLDSAKRYFKDESTAAVLENRNSLIRWAYLGNDFDKIIDYARKTSATENQLLSTGFVNEEAWTAYRTSEAYYSKGELSQAEHYLKRSVDLEPFNLEFRNKLGAVQLDLKKNAEAKKNFEFILKEDPHFISALTNLGFLLLSTSNRAAEADSLYDKALALDPDNLQALFNKAGVLIFMNRLEDADQILSRILSIDPSNEKARLIRRQLAAEKKNKHTAGPNGSGKGNR